MHNGQSSFEGLGLLDGAKLLSLDKVEEEWNRTNMTSPDGYPMIPVAELLGFKQWFVEASPNGVVYLVSGWNTFRKADNWRSLFRALIS